MQQLFWVLGKKFKTTPLKICGCLVLLANFIVKIFQFISFLIRLSQLSSRNLRQLIIQESLLFLSVTKRRIITVREPSILNSFNQKIRGVALSYASIPHLTPSFLKTNTDPVVDSMVVMYMMSQELTLIVIQRAITMLNFFFSLQ